jgi:hypothetical protein
MPVSRASGGRQTQSPSEIFDINGDWHYFGLAVPYIRTKHLNP